MTAKNGLDQEGEAVFQVFRFQGEASGFRVRVQGEG